MQINHYISGPLGVNCYLVVDENSKKAFIVDPGGNNSKLVDYAKANEIDVEYIILTHGHGDHIGGVKAYQAEFPAAKVVAHEAEKELLLDPRLNHSPMTCGVPISLAADLYVNDEETLAVGEMLLRFLFTPGHTPGGMCIYTGNALFSGDTLFAQSIGRTDFPGSSFEAIIHSIKSKLFVLPDNTEVFPGHMGNTTIATEKEYNPFV